MGFVDKDIPQQAVEAVDLAVKSVPEERIPAGYIPISLSTKGRLGVPALIHIRNFNTEDILDLSLAVEDILPTKTIQAINRAIWEKDVDVATWPEKSVIELLLLIYSNFFTPFLTEIPFPWNEEDIKYLEENNKKEMAASLVSGKWTPLIDINLAKDIVIQDLDPSIKDHVTFTKKDGSFSVTFSACPKIGDVILLKKALEQAYEEKEKSWKDFKQKLEIRERLIKAGQFEKLPIIEDSEYFSFMQYEGEKSLTLLKMTQAFYLVAFNGKDISKEPLSEKMKYFSDPRIDVKLSKKLDEQFKSLKFGIKDTIAVLNPITNKICERRFSFRPMDILQAIQSFDSSEYDIRYDDPNS